MTHIKKSAAGIFILWVSVFVFNGTAHGLDLNRLSQQDIKTVKDVLVKLSLLIKQKQQKHELITLTLPQLYAPLNAAQSKFLKNFEHLDANELNIKIPYRGLTVGKQLLMVTDQKIKDKDGFKSLPIQFLPEQVFISYINMMDAMQKDIGKRLYVESGYRSSAYQLYLFVSSLKNHNYSIRETAKFVALPGYSEHGDLEHQAIDFINEDGINCQSDAKNFEALPEYNWLLKNAQKFNFVLSYPKNSPEGITFEPWHWRFEKNISPK